MTLYVENANDIVLKKVRLDSTKIDITNGNFLVSICESHEFDVANIIEGVTTTIEMGGSLGLTNGDTVLVRRVRGASDANGFWTCSGVAGDNFTIAADTSVQTYEGGGKAWKVLLQEATFTYDENNGFYLCTIEDADVELTPGADYMLFIEDAALQVRIEFEDTAEVRVR